jgi:magnesium chelatase family protein
MSLAHLISRGQSGLEAYEVSVEVNIAGGLPAFAITGLPAPAVRESRDRVRAALQNCGFKWPASRVTAHLGPADIPKEGGRFDLAIALGIVQAQEKKSWQLAGLEFLGELSLAGALRPTTGVVPAALAARRASRRLIVPAANAAEAALVPGAEVLAARHLREVIGALDGEAELTRIEPRPPSGPPVARLSLDDVRGHAGAKRALCVAAAGEHNLLMIGPPGSGKSMLAARLPSLMPALADDELLSVASIASVAGDTSVLEKGRVRPFRSPHHTTRAPALVGGGAHPRPGEISLAHHGILFLDEFPEFSRTALEALREPLETGRVAISRLGRRIDFPARFQLIAAMNPCPCGFLGDGTDRCKCTPARLDAYRHRISGPLLDRFDLHIEVPRVSFAEIASQAAAGESAPLSKLVAQTRRRQIERAGRLNARLDTQSLWRVVELGTKERALLKRAVERWNLSARSSLRILKVARTIADLAVSQRVEAEHVAEALQLRCRDWQT